MNGNQQNQGEQQPQDLSQRAQPPFGGGSTQQPQQPQQPPTGAPSEPASPPPPQKPEAEMRTMESDIKSVEESGGGVPEPQVVSPQDTPVGEPAEPAEPKIVEEEEPGVRPWLIWTLVVATIIVLGVAAWFYVVPLFYQNDAPQVGQRVSQQQQQETTTPPEPAPFQPVFSLPESQMTRLEISGYSVVSILTALQNEASLVPEGSIVMEVVASVNGMPASFSQYLSALLPELTNSNLPATLANNFENNFGLLFYQDDGQIWPVYAVKKRASATIDQVTLINQLAALENASIGNLYLTPPVGEPRFQTGPVGESYTSRYASFENKPASFNYGLFGDYLILSTTYQGLLETLDLLGL